MSSSILLSSTPLFNLSLVLVLNSLARLLLSVWGRGYMPPSNICLSWAWKLLQAVFESSHKIMEGINSYHKMLFTLLTTLLKIKHFFSEKFIGGRQKIRRRFLLQPLIQKIVFFLSFLGKSVLVLSCTSALHWKHLIWYIWKKKHADQFDIYFPMYCNQYRLQNGIWR